MRRQNNLLAKAVIGRSVLAVTVGSACLFGVFGAADPSSVRAAGPERAVRIVPKADISRRVSARLFATTDIQSTCQFMRGWRIKGPALCRALRDAGLAMTEWRPASLRSITYECNFLRVFRRDQSQALSSIFVRVRGDSEGDIADVRGTILDPKMQPNGNMDAELMTVFETLVRQTHWKDFEEPLLRINKLETTEHRGFGADLRFSQDFELRKRYNFSFSIEADSEPQVLTMGVVTLSCPGREWADARGFQARHAAIFHSSNASRRW